MRIGIGCKWSNCSINLNVSLYCSTDPLEICFPDGVTLLPDAESEINFLANMNMIKRIFGHLLYFLLAVLLYFF
jgi:hypothetical protein